MAQKELTTNSAGSHCDSKTDKHEITKTINVDLLPCGNSNQKRLTNDAVSTRLKTIAYMNKPPRFTTLCHKSTQATPRLNSCAEFTHLSPGDQRVPN